jgi:hypothetical protein
MHAVAYWLRHCATNWKVAGSRPNEVDNFFNVPKPSGSSRPLGFTEPLIEMSTRSKKITLLQSRGQPVCKADNFTATCDP